MPVTDGKPQYASFPWFVEIPADPANGLVKVSGADGFQVKSLSLSRLDRMIGTVTLAQLSNIVATIALCTGFP